MLDYLTIQGSTENPTFVTILFTVLLSFLLSSLIAFTYEKTTRNVVTPMEFLQALILVSIVAAMVMQAIGDSVARGLGMLGALAIIRFRVSLRSTRNLVFTFASLAVGISCGVYGFVIGVTGTIGFCAIAFVLRFSPLGKTVPLIGNLKFAVPFSSTELKKVEVILNEYCEKFSQIKYQIVKQKTKNKNATLNDSDDSKINWKNPIPLKLGISEKDIENNEPKIIAPLLDSLESEPNENTPDFFERMIAYEYKLKLKNATDIEMLDLAIADLDAVRSVKINFASSPENV